MLLNSISLALEAKHTYEVQSWNLLAGFNPDFHNEFDLLASLQPYLKTYYDHLKALALTPSFYDQLPTLLNNEDNTYNNGILQQFLAVGLIHPDPVKRQHFYAQLKPDLSVSSLHKGINLLPDANILEWVKYRLQNHSQYFSARKEIYNYVSLRGYISEINDILTPIISNIVNQPIDQDRKYSSWQEIESDWLALSVGKYPPLIALVQKVYQMVLTHYPSEIFAHTYFLLPVLKETLDYIRSPQGLGFTVLTEKTQESLLKYLAEFGGPQDLDLFQKHFEKNPEDQTLIAEAIRLYGNPAAIAWMQTQLAHEDSHIAYLFQLALLSFFYDLDNSDTKDETYLKFRFNWETYGQEQVDVSLEDMPTEQRTTLLNQYWMFRSRWIRNNIQTNKRYMDGQLFDLLKYLRQLKYIGRRDELEMVFHNIHTYTGEFFPFDPHANLEVQFAQIKALEDFLEANQERFPVGGWFYQGKSY